MEAIAIIAFHLVIEGFGVRKALASAPDEKEEQRMEISIRIIAVGLFA